MDVTQFENLAIFLPFLFYVKSILADFIRSKTAILTSLEAFDFMRNVTIENVKNTQKFDFKAAHMVKTAIFEASKWPKLISRKI